MPPSKITPSNIFTLWEKINSLLGKIPQGHLKFKVDLVTIAKEKE